MPISKFLFYFLYPRHRAHSVLSLAIKTSATYWLLTITRGFRAKIRKKPERKTQLINKEEQLSFTNNSLFFLFPFPDFIFLILFHFFIFSPLFLPVVLHTSVKITSKKISTTMLSRFVGLARPARAYSSVQKNDSALFLSDLMKRIDSINTRTKRIAEAKSSAKPEPKNQKRKPVATKTATKTATKPPTKTSDSKTTNTTPKFRARKETARISVKDHPLSRNTFKLMDESNFKKPERSRRVNPPSRSQIRPAAAKSGGSKPSARTGGSQMARARPPRRTASGSPAPGRIVQKELVVKDYKPAVSGDDFFYGKPASLAFSTSSRVAAVAKETLLESKYPYKLPKSIIDKLDSSFTGNRFLLQKDYSLDVDVAKFGSRINQVVKGEVDTINLGKKPVATSVFTATQLARNGDLSIAQQQTIYDVASGLKSAKLLVETAVWNK